VVKDKQFDVKQGKLITIYQCKRCDKTKTTSH
jgi:ribosomal protein S17